MQVRSKLLIVDDERLGRDTLEALLASEGYDLAFASNGLEALLEAARVIPDLVLLDVMMPGMDGYEVCRRLRQDGPLAEVPIIMVTALDDRRSRLVGLEAGADDFISKPFDHLELRARVRTVVRLNRYRHLREQKERVEQAYSELENTYDATLRGWVYALDLRDNETEGHSERVSTMTLQLAKLLGFSEEEHIHLARGALLHDIGKMGVPDAILHKPGRLTEEEFKVMQRHPQLAYNMLAPIPYLRPAIDIPYCHHEKWDGTGYPRGLKGTEIPKSARMFAVVDVYDAMRSDRPYRQGWPKERVLEHIRGLSGTHFDPEVVTAMLTLMG